MFKGTGLQRSRPIYELLASGIYAFTDLDPSKLHMISISFRGLGIE